MTEAGAPELARVYSSTRPHPSVRVCGHHRPTPQPPPPTTLLISPTLRTHPPKRPTRLSLFAHTHYTQSMALLSRPFLSSSSSPAPPAPTPAVPAGGRLPSAGLDALLEAYPSQPSWDDQPADAPKGSRVDPAAVQKAAKPMFWGWGVRDVWDAGWMVFGKGEPELAAPLSCASLCALPLTVFDARLDRIGQ